MKAKSSLLLRLVLIILCAAPVVAQEAMSESYFQAALGAYGRGNHGESERLARLGLSEAERLRATNPEAASRIIIRGLNILSGALIEQRKYTEAERAKREEIRVLESIRSQDYPEYTTNYPMSLESLGFILMEQNRYEEAEETYRRALAYRERVYGSSHKNISISLINMGNLYLRQGRLSEAEVMSRRALGIFGEALDNGEFTQDDVFPFLRAARVLAQVSVQRRSYTEAERQYRFMVSTIERFYGARDQSLIEPLEEYARLLRTMRRPAEATRIESRISQLRANSDRNR